MAAQWYIVAAISNKHLKGHSKFDCFQPADFETCAVMDNLKVVESVAKNMAKNYPGCEIHTMKTFGLFISEIPKVNQLTVNDKGEVLPV